MIEAVIGGGLGGLFLVALGIGAAILLRRYVHYIYQNWG